ncbi:MAG: hypothetical protein NVSMB17_17280 [Candidatus Dormibacteria bacterium]
MADARPLGPTRLTRAFAEAGRLSLGRLFHFDLRGLAARAADLRAQHGDSPALGRATGLVRWAGLLVRNLELTLYWGALWALLHLLVAIGGSLAWPHGGTPLRLWRAVDYFPALLFVGSVLRLALTTARVRQLSSSPGADPTLPRLVNPAPGPLLPRLLQPSDLDLAAAAVVTVAAVMLA